VAKAPLICELGRPRTQIFEGQVRRRAERRFEDLDMVVGHDDRIADLTQYADRP
jgi:hypothetical protein